MFGRKRLDVEENYWYKIKPHTLRNGRDIRIAVWCYKGSYHELSFFHRLFHFPETYMCGKFNTEDLETAIERAKTRARQKWEKKADVQNAVE